MKTKMMSLIVLFLIISMTLFAQYKTEKFEVSGNCGMCKSRIEKASKSLEGVVTANWDIKSKIAEVKFDSTKTDINKIQMAIAKAGHDTEHFKATDEAYDKLPACCKYERKKNVR
jgi:mercuric ion binding protein